MPFDNSERLYPLRIGDLITPRVVPSVQPWASFPNWSALTTSSAGATSLPAGVREGAREDLGRGFGGIGPGGKIAFYLFLGALAMHLLFLMQFAHSPFFWVPAIDAQYHNIMAKQILGHSLPAEPFFRPPAYGYFLAGLYTVFGVESFVAVRLVHAVVGSAAVGFLFLIGRRLFSTRVGLLAAISMALYGPLILQLSDLHTTVLEVFCLVLFSWLFLKLMEAGSLGRTALLLAASAGLVLGVWASARLNALLAVPVALAWMPGRGLTRRFFSVCLAFLAGAVLLPLVITVRNAIVGKDPVFVAWFGGINLYLANQPGSDGMRSGSPKRYHYQGDYAEVVAIFAKKEAERAVGHPLKCSEIDRYWRHRAADFWREQPLAALKLAGKKLVLIFTRSEIRNIIGFDYLRAEWAPILAVAFVGFWYAGPFGLLGMALAWRSHRLSRPLGLLTALYLLHLVLFIAADRYRIVFVPLLLLFSAYAVFEIFDGICARDTKGLVPPLFALAALLVFVNVSWYQTNGASDWAKDFWSAGNRFNALKQHDLAEVEMRKALNLYSKDADIWSGLGESLYYQKKFTEAAAAFFRGRAARSRPFPTALQPGVVRRGTGPPPGSAQHPDRPLTAGPGIQTRQRPPA